jgi:hypothetical protein
MQLTLALSSPKTSLGGLAPTADTLSALSSPVWWDTIPLSFRQKTAEGSGQTRVWLMDPADARHGGYSMPNISDSPNDAAVCSLSSVLEARPIPQRYYLSPRACAGILRRAAKREKELPAALVHALRAVTLRHQDKT